MAYLSFLKKIGKLFIVLNVEREKKTDTDRNVYIKHNYIRNVALNIGKDRSDNYYGETSKIDKNAENGYYLVKWTSDSYTFQYSHMIGRDFIKDG